MKVNSLKITNRIPWSTSKILAFGFVLNMLVIGINGSAQNALNFDGVDDQITVTENIDIVEQNERTVEAWIKTSATGDQCIVMWGEEVTGKRWAVRLENETVRLELENGFINTTEAILNDGVWHHIAVVLPTGGTTLDDILIYVDGNLEPHTSHFRYVDTTNSPIIIGNGVFHNDRFFNGNIDELRIWNVGRTQSQIVAGMYADLCNAPGLVAYYPFNEGIANDDNTGEQTSNENVNGNNGTLENFALNGTNGNWTEGVEMMPITGTDVLDPCGPITWIDGIVYDAPNNTATFNLVGGSITGCDSLVTLNLTITPLDATVTTSDPSITANLSGATYQWLDCDNNMTEIDGETDQTFLPAENGNYAVAVSKDGCTEISDCVTIVAVSVDSNPIFKKTSIFPNPNKGLVNIKLGNIKTADVQVYDMAGKMVFQKKNINSKTFQFELNAPAGTYLIKLESEGMQKHYKLVRQ